MNTQLRIAFVLAFILIGAAALAEDGGAVGTPTSKAGQALATAAHLAEAPPMMSRYLRRRARKAMV